MKITLIAVGKLKTAYWAAAQADYVKRVHHYASFNVVEVKDRVGQGLENEAALEKEGQDILQAADDAPALIALTPAGKLMDSPAWAAALRRWSETYKRLAFVIGGPNGLSEPVLKKSRMPFALSPMTFPHEMARVIFLEQLYRAYTILSGTKYHK